MKKIILPLMLIFSAVAFCPSANAIGSYAVKDTLHVLTLAGLKLRTSPKLESGVRRLLPYGSFVIVKALTTTRDSVPEAEGYGIHGSWVEVVTEHGEGFVFDGYLSHFKPPKITEQNGQGSSMESYVQELYTPMSKKMPASKNPQEFNQLFSQGIKFAKRVAPDSSGYGRIMIREISLEEAYLIANVICRTEAGAATKTAYAAADALKVIFKFNEIMMEPNSGEGLAVRIVREEEKGGGGGAVIQYRHIQPKTDGSPAEE